jgi:hypothetical protein
MDYGVKVISVKRIKKRIEAKVPSIGPEMFKNIRKNINFRLQTYVEFHDHPNKII